jgi:putative membrane protein
MAQSGAGTPGQMGQPSLGQQGQPEIGRPGGSPGGLGNNMPDSMSTDSAADDRTFLMKAAQGGIAEVNFGNMAQQNGGSDAVKHFGEKMVADHSRANDELRQLAQQKGVSLPSNVSGKDKRVAKMLGAKQGPDFDRAYIHDMVKDHEEDIAEFRDEAEHGRDPDVKAWAQKTLPTLEQHLAMARKVAGQLNGKEAAGAMSSQQ